MRRRSALAAAAIAAAWTAWAGLPHLAALACARRGPGSGRRIALTFDDGPDPEWTPRVLDILDAAAVPGTFFLIGERAARAPAVVRTIDAAGHEIGNHTWAHRHPWRLGPGRTRDEIRRGHEILAALARPPRLFRPPWGLVNATTLSAARRCGERCVFWSIQPEGLRPQPAGAQVAHVLGRAHPGAIVDLHDADGVPGAPGRLAAALPSMIEGLRAAGYAFVTVTALLGSDGAPGGGDVTSARRGTPPRQ